VTVRKSGLNSGNACYSSSSILSYFLQSTSINIEIKRRVILLVVLYECETWSLTMREKHKMRDLLNWNEWKIIGLNGKKVTGDCRTLYIEKFHDLYSPNTVVRMRLVGNVACMGNWRVA
jgi:hypothetical protein